MRLNHAILSGELRLANASTGVPLADFLNVGVRELGVGVFSACEGSRSAAVPAQNIRRAAPALPHFVVGVVLMGADEQVGGIDARRIVAVMADKQSIGDWADVQLVGYPMSHPNLSRKMKYAVSERPTPRTRPSPTPIRSTDVSLKAFRQRQSLVPRPPSLNHAGTTTKPDGVFGPSNASGPHPKGGTANIARFLDPRHSEIYSVFSMKSTGMFSRIRRIA